MSLAFLINIDKAFLLVIRGHPDFRCLGFPTAGKVTKAGCSLEPTTNDVFLPSDRQQITSSADRISLNSVSRQKFESMTQTVTIPHQRPQFQGSAATRKRQFQGRDFPRLQLAGQRDPNAVLSELDRSPPQLNGSLCAEHFCRHSNVQRITGKAALFGRVHSFSGVRRADAHSISLSE